MEDAKLAALAPNWERANLDAETYLERSVRSWYSDECVKVNRLRERNLISQALQQTRHITLERKRNKIKALLAVSCALLHEGANRASGQWEGYAYKSMEIHSVILDVRIELGSSYDIKPLIVNKDGTFYRCGWGEILKVFNKDTDNCPDCGEKHTRYGMEAEILALDGDQTYRDVLLRKLNRKLHLNKSTDNFGIDGSGKPLEIRNINASTIPKLVSSYSARLDSLMNGLYFMADNFPYINKDYRFDNCGIHIHQLYEDTKPAALVNAHSLVGMLVNSLEPAIWNSRLQNGYGNPFNSRPVEWCSNSEIGTELRVFNVLHPHTLRTALDIQEELSEKKSANNGKIADEYTTLKSLGTIREERLALSSANFNGMLSLFVKKDIFSISEIIKAQKRLLKNYFPVLGKRHKIVESLLSEKFIRETLSKGKKKKTNELSELATVSADFDSQEIALAEQNNENIDRR